MADTAFFFRNDATTLAILAELSGSALRNPDDSDYLIKDVAPLHLASLHDITFLDNSKYRAAFRECRAGACVVHEKYAHDAPPSVRLLIADDPYRAYAFIAQYFYREPRNSKACISPNAFIDDTATIADSVHIGHGASIGAGVTIGEGCMIGTNAVIGRGVTLGAYCRIGAGAVISHAIIGDNVTIHNGAQIGQDGFGFAMSSAGHLKVPQLGRVLIENDVEIGAGTCIDRGAGPDTIIGLGSKIDNLVQVGHNVRIGKHVIIVAQTGIAGSVVIEDFAVIGGQVGIAGHLRIGMGARLAAKTGVVSDIPPGATYGGIPAVPVKDWHRQTVTLARLIKESKVS